MKALMAAVGTVATVWAAVAQAHSWYPPECCHDRDCAPVEKVTWLVPVDGGKPRIIVRSKKGTAVIPRDMMPRDSKDDRMHVCIGYDSFGDHEVWCYFVPPHIS